MLFRDAWGDCPAGCIDEELSLVKVIGREVTEIDVGGAEANEVFVELASLVGSRSYER